MAVFGAIIELNGWMEKDLRPPELKFATASDGNHGMTSKVPACLLSAVQLRLAVSTFNDNFDCLFSDPGTNDNVFEAFGHTALRHCHTRPWFGGAERLRLRLVLLPWERPTRPQGAAARYLISLYELSAVLLSKIRHPQRPQSRAGWATVVPDDMIL
jgi:hypothetical protein